MIIFTNTHFKDSGTFLGAQFAQPSHVTKTTKLERSTSEFFASYSK